MSLTKLAEASRDHYSFTVAVSIQHDVSRNYKQTTIVRSPDILAMPIEWRQHYFSVFPTHESLFTANKALAKASLKDNLFQNIWIDVLHEFLRDDLFGTVIEKAAEEGLTQRHKRLNSLLATLYAQISAFLLDQQSGYSGLQLPNILWVESKDTNTSTSWFQPNPMDASCLPSFSPTVSKSTVEKSELERSEKNTSQYGKQKAS